MASQRQRLLVVLGSGPGIGTHVASRFVSEGFSRVALMARSAPQLDQDKEGIQRSAPAGVTVKTYQVDVTHLPQLKKTLEQVDKELGVAECVFFNAARVRPSPLLEVDEEDMVYDFKVSCTALHAAARHFVPQLVGLARADPSSRPSLLITSSHLPQQPEPDLFVLSMVKAAQRNMAESMAKLLGPQGVRIGLVVVSGVVRRDSKRLNPENIAHQTWGLFAQPRERQDFEVKITEDGQ